MNGKFKRIGSLVLALGITAGLLAGCGSSSTSGNPAGSGSAGGTGSVKDTLTVALTDEPDYLSTCDTDSLMGAQMNLLTYNGLTRIDMETLQPVLDLADNYTQDSDTEWTFSLKKGVTFQNGDPFTADDVKASIEYAQTFDRTATYTGSIAEVQVVDENTVKIVTAEPAPNLLYDLAYHFNYILPHSLIESGNDFSANPVGTGAYKLVSWDKGNTITFEANADYFDADRTPSIKNLVFSIIPEGTTRTMALESGDVDFVYSVASSDIDRLKSAEGIDVKEIVSVENFFLYLNAVNGDFTDSNLRLAVAYAINRDDIVAGALNGYGTPSYSTVSMGYPESVNTNSYSYNLDKAKEYLAAWGGDPSKVKLEIICSNDTKTAIATIMQAELAEIGINVVIDSTDSATYQTAMATDTLSAAIVSWSPANAATYVSRFHSDRHGNTPASVSTDEMDGLVDKLRVEMDPDSRTQLIQEITAEANAGCWFVPIYQVNYSRAHSDKLHSVVCSATGYVDFSTMYWG
ncbi:ABC transporter substrate-binding protein [Oscillibacter sp. GMB15532]|uniref:ABC transporter substrate-binding protein n=1 Tax=Oscillibacter sp. GMB15532 TaxID=3230022 RepID=UPI0034DFFFA1